MSRDEVSGTAEEMDRREFFRHVGVGGMAGSLVSSAQGQSASSQTQSADISAQYPGAHYFVGPWRLRIDRDNVGKTQKWHLKEPSDAIAPAAAVMVPSCWQEYLPEFSGGVGWYFKEFTLPAALKDRVMRLKFWAVDYFAEVWINGRPVGSHEGGFTPFEFDITAQAKFGGENHLVVRVVDPPRPLEQSLLGLPGWEGTSDGIADGFKFREIPMGPQSWQEGLNFGGIWQAVELLETSLLHVSDVFVEPKLAENAIEVHVEVNNKELKGVSGTIRVVVRPWKELTVAGQGERAESLGPGLQVANVRVAIEHPRPWTPDDPYLYVAEVSVQEGGIVRHSTSARFGLREFSVRDGFFQLNGKRIFIKGGHHQGTYPTKLVFPPSREFAYKEVQIFKEAGFNFCRLWVKPAPPAFLDAADELGLMVQEEPPFSIMEDSPFMRERTLREVREMVKRDRNRPSIVVWNMINEADPAMKYVREQCSAARELDPSRLITETAGGPTHYYVPYSNVGVSYLDEHPYPGAPLADDVYEYNRTRGVVGQLTFFSEYGYGGMNDIESVLAHYGEHPKRHMEDYSGHVRLKQIRDSAFEQSDALKRIFGSMEKLREACQTVQADAVRLQTEAMRCNPATGGYNYVQVFDSNAFEIDGLVDFWRDKRKKAFYAMQDANKPLLLVIRCSRMNARSDEDFELQVMLVNEERVTGPRRLTVRIQSPSGTEVFRKEITVEVKPWISTLFQEKVNVKGESGRYPIEALCGTNPRRSFTKKSSAPSSPRRT
jgi:beta-galactosidase/beta-glucuronidase